jgi:AraC-like DNA-binding protein
VEEVAAAVGYESEAAFSRALKKLVGEAPATWRRANVTRAASTSARASSDLPQRDVTPTNTPISAVAIRRRKSA